MKRLKLFNGLVLALVIEHHPKPSGCDFTPYGDNHGIGNKAQATARTLKGRPRETLGKVTDDEQKQTSWQGEAAKPKACTLSRMQRAGPGLALILDLGIGESPGCYQGTDYHYLHINSPNIRSNVMLPLLSSSFWSVAGFIAASLVLGGDRWFSRPAIGPIPVPGLHCDGLDLISTGRRSRRNPIHSGSALQIQPFGRLRSCHQPWPAMARNAAT